VQERIEQDAVVWLVTVDANGTPQPSPVWFLWEADSMLIFSQPDTPKLRNIARSPRVAVHFDGDANGNDIVVMTGSAAIESSGPAATDIPTYITKYGEGIAGEGMTNESFAKEYSVPIRVTPEKLRGH